MASAASCRKVSTPRRTCPKLLKRCWLAATPLMTAEKFSAATCSESSAKWKQFQRNCKPKIAPESPTNSHLTCHRNSFTRSCPTFTLGDSRMRLLPRLTAALFTAALLASPAFTFADDDTPATKSDTKTADKASDKSTE